MSSSSRKRRTIYDSSDEEDEVVPVRKSKISRSRGKLSKSRSNSPVGIPKQAKSDDIDAKPSLLIQSMQPKPDSSGTGGNRVKPSPLVQSMQPKPHQRAQTKPQPTVPVGPSNVSIRRDSRDRPRPPIHRHPGPTSPVRNEAPNPLSPHPGYPQQTAQKSFSDQEQKVLRKLSQICNSITLTFPLQKEIDLGGSFIEKDIELNIFDKNRDGEVVLQPRVPIFPEDFSQGQKEWPLSWWGIEEPDARFLEKKSPHHNHNHNHSSSRHAKRDDRQRSRSRDRRGGGDRRGDYPRPTNHSQGPGLAPPERNSFHHHRDYYYGPPGGRYNGPAYSRR